MGSLNSLNEKSLKKQGEDPFTGNAAALLFPGSPNAAIANCHISLLTVDIGLNSDKTMQIYEDQEDALSA